MKKILLTLLASVLLLTVLLLINTFRFTSQQIEVEPAATINVEADGASRRLSQATTDSRHYAALTDNIYRFRPHRYRPDDVKRFHGVNERIAVDGYVESVKFYYQLIKNSAQ